MDNRNLLINALENYIDLLGEELSDVVGLAIVHGWKSSRIEEGKQQREEIDRLKKLVFPDMIEQDVVE